MVFREGDVIAPRDALMERVMSSGHGVLSRDALSRGVVVTAHPTRTAAWPVRRMYAVNMYVQLQPLLFACNTGLTCIPLGYSAERARLREGQILTPTPTPPNRGAGEASIESSTSSFLGNLVIFLKKPQVKSMLGQKPKLSLLA